jgi:CubicO group peptidase (beta-lactamase class C family)
VLARSGFIAFVVLWAAVARADTLDRQIRAAMDRDGVPALTLAVVRHGRIVRIGAYGYGDLEWKTKATPETRFEIASVSKMFVGAVIRMLIDEGKLDPEDLVSKYLSGLPDSWNTMRIRHLLTMSSGLPEDWGSEAIPYDDDVVTHYDDASMLKAFTILKLKAPVGTEFHYSGPGYAMLGMIASKVAGQPLAELLAERIFKPADMAETSFIDNAAIVPERAQGYRKAEGKLFKGRFVGQYLHARADTGLMSTARDLAKWIVALEQGRIVKDPQTLWQGATSDAGRPLDYSYGWFVNTLPGHRLQHHNGNYRTGFQSVIRRFPDDDLSVVALANCDCARVEKYAALAVRSYLRDLPDPETESTLADPDPKQTATLIDALRSVAQGKVDERVMTADALDPVPIADAAERLSAVRSFVFAGRHRLPGQGWTMHGHRLVDFTTLKLQGDGFTLYLTLYRDDQGRIGYVMPGM